MQEAVLNKNAMVMCGAHSQEWNALLQPASQSMTVSHPLSGISGPSRWNKLVDMQKRSFNLDMVLTNAILRDASDPRDKVYGLRKSLAMILELQALICLVGLFERQPIPVDYSLSLSEVYRLMTQA